MSLRFVHSSYEKLNSSIWKHLRVADGVGISQKTKGEVPATDERMVLSTLDALTEGVVSAPFALSPSCNHFAAPHVMDIPKIALAGALLRAHPGALSCP